jgi:hypothetical protein
MLTVSELFQQFPQSYDPYFLFFGLFFSAAFSFDPFRFLSISPSALPVFLGETAKKNLTMFQETKERATKQTRKSIKHSALIKKKHSQRAEINRFEVETSLG